jgi:hypothetical protein
VWRCESCGGPQANGGPQGVQVGGDALIESVELVTLLLSESRVRDHGTEQSRRERGVDALEELQKQDADAVALGQESMATGVRDFLDEAL